MKKFSTLLAATLLLGSALPAVAQESKPPRTIRPEPTPDPANGKSLTRFDLDFPGGTPADFAAAISKAMGKHLNIIIPAEQAHAKIMPIKVKGVTVPQLLMAVERAGNHQELFFSLENGRKKAEWVNVSISFVSMVQDGDETIWSVVNTGANVEAMKEKNEAELPPPVCRYFQLASYLEGYSIEDITTAIQTGWKMAKVDPMPQLSFHRETKLLIAVGPEASVNLIPEVLGSLFRNRSPVIDRIVELQTELDAELAKSSGVDGKKCDALRGKIRELAARQKANEEIDRGGNNGGETAPRRIIRPATPTN